MKKTFFFPNRLDDSRESVKDSPNNEKQAAEQPPKTPWFLRIQEALDLRGLARAVGLGFLCGEPTENTQPEKKSPLKRQGINKKAIIAILALATVLTPVSVLAVHPIVVFLIGWASDQTLTTAKQATIDKWLAVKKATASVNGAYWVSNSYSYNGTMADGVELIHGLSGLLSPPMRVSK